MVRTLSRGAAIDHILRGELPPIMFLIDAFLPLLYFEEKVHKKKLQRADCIPSSFKAAMPNSGALGYPSEPQLERKRICRELLLSINGKHDSYKVDQPEQPAAARRASPRHIPEGITVAAPAIPRAPPAAPASSQPSTSAEPRMAIPISEYRELCRHWRPHSFSEQSCSEWQPLEHAKRCWHQPRADVGHSGQHTAILRQLQLHFDCHQL
ncbi:hypothetical protein CK203_031210 [Vitis vinifera]|uniref:Uncharacterized protein n=1 Tax=Vitis vinifera TaxID=29760 RepID=A0A438J0L6_VITVI|nr:hypothetical protein CK203_031210 [Vitis vinifera]